MCFLSICSSVSTNGEGVVKSIIHKYNDHILLFLLFGSGHVTLFDCTEDTEIFNLSPSNENSKYIDITCIEGLIL